MQKLLLTVATLLLLSGCARQTFTLKNEPVFAPKETVTQHFFFYGIGQKKELDAAAICGGEEKIVGTETETTFLNGLFNVVTLGIYAPREAKVYCMK